MQLFLDKLGKVWMHLKLENIDELNKAARIHAKAIDMEELQHVADAWFVPCALDFLRYKPFQCAWALLFNLARLFSPI